MDEPAGGRYRAQDRRKAGLLDACAPKLERVKKLLAQKPDDNNKIYAPHAPEVECIAKGKALTRYEFGVKVSIGRHQRARRRRPVRRRHPRDPWPSK